MTDDPDDKTPGFGDLSSPFLFVPHGAPEPTEWMRKHPGWVKFPATFVPRAPAAVRTIPGTNRPWPLDKRGQPWPRSRFGQPLRPLDEYPPGVRAPGEGYTGPIADPDAAMRAASASKDVLAQAARFAADPDAPIRAYLSAMEVWKNPGRYAGYPWPGAARAPSQAERDADAIRAGMDRARATGTGGGVRVAANTARTMNDAAPPPLDAQRPFVVGESYDRARRRVRDTPPRTGSVDVLVPVLPGGDYQAGLDGLMQRIAGARPEDEAQLRRDIRELYQQPGANRTGEMLQRALTDALDAGGDLRARQAILNDIAPVAKTDPELLASQEFGLPGMVLGSVAATPGKLVGAGTAGTVAYANTWPALIDELVSNGVKFTPTGLTRIQKLNDGQIVFLERGNSRSGLQHIVERHGAQFFKAGIPETKIADFLMDALKNGRIVGYQGGSNTRVITHPPGA